MHKQKRTSVISLGRKALGVAVASTLMVMSSAHATGMGRLTVLSALGQPLKAEIELTSPGKDEISSLVPKLASADAYRQANIEFNAALLSLRFSIEPKGAGYIIKVSSTQAMNEPFVDMLLEMTSSNGKLLREYTFLLDPAELRNGQAPQVAQPNSVAAKAAPEAGNRSSQAPAIAIQPSATKKNTNAPAAQAVKAGTEHVVKPGDTLSKIAGNYKPDGVSLDQMLVGLYRANPNAFTGKNMNRLRAGQILVVPDADAVKSSAASNAEAHSVVMAHAADFNSYRGKLAEQVERAPAEKRSAGKQTASGSITAKVKELPTPTGDSPDKLKLSKAAPADVKGGKGKGVAEEDKIAKEKATAEANSRLKELEKNVGDLQRLLDVKNKDLAAKEAELASKAKQQDKASATALTTPAADKAKVAASLPAATAVASASATKTPESASALASVPVAASASATVASDASASDKPVVRRKPVPPPPPPAPEPSFFESISDWLMPAGIALIAVLGGAGFWASQRKKKMQQFEDSILTGSSMKANSMFGSTGGQSVDTNNSVFNSNFAPSASQLDANEVDPVAEADVYIAYGRDSQAEEILKEALRTQPDRHAVRLKLLEIYFARKDTKQFERLASELYGMTSGAGDEWAQAASMGVSLEPGNPLYAGGQLKQDTSITAGLGNSTQPLEDLDPDALLGNSLSRDMLEAISIIDTASHAENKDTAEPTANVAVDVPDSAQHLDAGALDFDLGLDLAEVPQIPEPVSAAPQQEPVPEVDFGAIDFDFGDAKPAAEAPVIAEAAATSVDDSHLLDFDQVDLGALDFALSDTASEAPASHAEESLAVLDLPAEDEPHSDAESHSAVPQEIDQASAFEFDLSGISLDLPSDVPAPEQHVEADNAEMATKLDLAVAYQEIGDKEGAKELLDEVLKGGSAAQKERANAMLLQLA
ncbi:FimV/HubP family polar landmark protein [Undibacterium rugosum]|uniref:FimV family protein n=1 Tax=Undibacterium rugosum TaxID=2762291 RepID=A0A923HZV3_9BURK|nr:FimV/HubP family polar landmark protein [Undibacterium rugosum]MBC3935071.1 FimV family protein [Undibacterium rugosum]MBR7778068.1 FimV family protein [Undibacterium rugosum]